MTIIPMRDLKDTVETERRCAAGGPVFVTKNGYGRLVVMDIEYYEKMKGKIYEEELANDGLPNPAAAQNLGRKVFELIDMVRAYH